MSVLDGIGDLVDAWLQIKPVGKPACYRHRTAALSLSDRPTPITGTLPFLDASYSKIQDNWQGAIEAGYSNPSRENWRWKHHLDLAPANSSPELRLERSIVQVCGSEWCNQVPTASGLVGAHADKRAAIDLARRLDSFTFELIELKVDSDNPLFAAIEILMYGLLLVWSIEHDRTPRFEHV